MDAIQYLLHLHSCEQEGISSGMPTPQQWIDAVEAARKQHAEQYSGEWISVNSPPEFGQLCETYNEMGEYGFFWYRPSNLYLDSRSPFIDDKGYHSQFKITHYKIPQPPTKKP